MSIKLIELAHGAVLARLFRSDRPALRMVETNRDESGRVYLINDLVYIYIKHSVSPRLSERTDVCSWTFSFNANHLNFMQQCNTAQKQLCLALVCLQKDMSSESTAIAFLNWDEISRCLDWQQMDEQQTITVRYQERCNLRVWGPRNTADRPLNVNQSALDRWDVPGV